MVITEIKKQRNHLFAIVFDDNSEALIDKKTVIDSGLFIGQTLGKNELASLSEESDYQRAFSRAIWYIEQGDISKKALKLKLLRAKFTEKSTEKAISRLLELSLLDDARLAERLAEKLLSSNISKRAALSKMAAKGIDFSLAKEVLEQSVCSPEAQIRAVIDKKYKNKLSSPEGVRKVFAALQRLGFGYSDIRAVLKAYSEELEFSEENYGL